jgi:hypothetical protein
LVLDWGVVLNNAALLEHTFQFIAGFGRICQSPLGGIFEKIGVTFKGIWVFIPRRWVKPLGDGSQRIGADGNGLRQRILTTDWTADFDHGLHGLGSRFWERNGVDEGNPGDADERGGRGDNSLMKPISTVWDKAFFNHRYHSWTQMGFLA